MSGRGLLRPDAQKVLVTTKLFRDLVNGTTNKLSSHILGRDNLARLFHIGETIVIMPIYEAGCDAVKRIERNVKEIRVEDDGTEILILDKTEADRSHNLKILHKYYTALTSGRKNFELRKDDRNYCVGDTLLLLEIDDTGRYTGQGQLRKISYILRDCPEYGLLTGFCILGLQELSDWGRNKS